MKGVSEFVVVLIILIIVIASILAVWLFYNSMFVSTVKSGATSSMGEALSSCMAIDSAANNKIYLRNCGTGMVSNDSINIYMDDAPIAFTMNPSSIGKGYVAEIALSGLWGMSLGNHKIRVSSKAGEVERYVKAELPVSTVLDLEFDEGGGNNAYDSSGQGNDFVIQGMPNIAWTNGRFNSGLWINSSLSTGCVDQGSAIINAAQLPESIKTLTWSQFTISMWVNYVTIKDGTLFHLDTNQSGPNGWFSGFYLYRDYISVANNTGNNTGIGFVNDLPFNSWNHILYVFDNVNTHTQSIYVNGTLVSTSNLYGTYGNITGIYFGAYYPSCEDATSGNSLDDIRLFNKSLTPDQTVSLSLGEQD